MHSSQSKVINKRRRFRKEVTGILTCFMVLFALLAGQAWWDNRTEHPYKQDVTEAKQTSQKKEEIVNHNSDYVGPPIVVSDKGNTSDNTTVVEEPTVGSNVVNNAFTPDNSMSNDDVVPMVDVNGNYIPGDGIGYLTVEKGYTLWDIAVMVYHDGSKWTEIYELNKAGLIKADARNAKDPGHWIYPGQIIKIHE